MASSSPYASDVGQADLVEFIDWRSVECLNQKSSHPVVNTMKLGYRENENLFLESDVDEQILIYIPFTQVVKLHSFLMLGPEDEGPKTVKFYVNKEHMGFSNVNDYSPSDTVVLNQKNLEGEPVNLKYVKFQNVRSLTIFIEDNQNGEEVTKLGRVILYGSTVDTTNMKDLKKVEEH